MMVMTFLCCIYIGMGEGVLLLISRIFSGYSGRAQHPIEDRRSIKHNKEFFFIRDDDEENGNQTFTPLSSKP